MPLNKLQRRFWRKIRWCVRLPGRLYVRHRSVFDASCGNSLAWMPSLRLGSLSRIHGRDLEDRLDVSTQTWCSTRTSTLLGPIDGRYSEDVARVWNSGHGHLQDRLDDVELRQTESSSTSGRGDDDAAGPLDRKLAEVKLVLVVMDALLVLHRLTILCLDVASLNSTRSSSQRSSRLIATEDDATATQSRLVGDKKHDQQQQQQLQQQPQSEAQQGQSAPDVIDVKTATHLHAGPITSEPFISTCSSPPANVRSASGFYF